MCQWPTAYHRHMPVAFRLSPAAPAAFPLSQACTSDFPPVTSASQWPSPSHWQVPVAVSLSLALACDLPPPTGMHWWPLPLTGSLVAFPLSPAGPGSRSRVTCMCLCPSTCQWCMLVPCLMAPSCACSLPPVNDGGLLPVIGACHWLSVCHRSVPVAFPLTGACQWPSPSHRTALVTFPLLCHTPVALALSPRHAVGLSPLTSPHR